MATIFVLLLGLARSWAADAGSYTEDGIAKHSAALARAADALGPRDAAMQDELARLGEALGALERGAVAFRALAPADFLAWATAQRRRGAAAGLQAQKHADLIAADTEQVFRAAITRALAKLQPAPALCTTRASSLPRPGGAPRPGCPAPDRSAELARAIDQDPALTAAMAEIAALPFPQPAVERQAWAPAPLTGAARHLRADALRSARDPGHAEAAAAGLDARLRPFLDGIDAGDPAALAAAKDARATWDAAEAARGAALADALKAALPKLSGAPAAVGLCLNPVALGGCTGEDVTDTLLPLLAADPRLQKARKSWPAGGVAP